MRRRRRLFRLVPLVAGFYVLVYGLALSPLHTARRSAARPRARRAAEADEKPPPRPAEGVPYSPIPEFPGRLVALEGQLLQPETREWRYIVVHHSGGPSGNAAEFDKMHREVNHWENGLGYHFVVGNGNGSPLGCIEVGGRWLRQLQGAHAGVGATEYNEHGIGICVVGNYDEEEFPEGAYEALRDLVVWLAKRYSIPPSRILPHKGVRLEPTECPGKNFPLERLRGDVGGAMK